MKLKWILVYPCFSAAALAVAVYAFFMGNHSACLLAAWIGMGFLGAYSAGQLQHHVKNRCWAFPVFVFAASMLGAVGEDYAFGQQLFASINDFWIMVAAGLFVYGFAVEKKRLDRQAALQPVTSARGTLR